MRQVDSTTDGGAIPKASLRTASRTIELLLHTNNLLLGMSRLPLLDPQRYVSMYATSDEVRRSIARVGAFQVSPFHLHFLSFSKILTKM